tara:strand:- start:858 stop:1235 length:378 start_codon:yes stop_codon:yes gene_type:complete
MLTPFFTCYNFFSRKQLPHNYLPATVWKDLFSIQITVALHVMICIIIRNQTGKSPQQQREERKMKETLETLQFTTAADLRDWLNALKTTDLSTVYVESNSGSVLTLEFEEETLTDGSKVNNMIVS